MATREEQIAGIVARNTRFDIRVEWLGDQFARGFRATLEARVRLAAQLIRDKAVINVSTPVHKYKGPQGGIVVDEDSRSEPGEYPHAETTLLMTTIFYQRQARTRGRISFIVGTPLDYGLILETVMDRSFLKRTMDEMQPALRRILVGPGRGRTRFE